MKRLLFALLVLSLSIPLIGCSNIEEQRAKKAMGKYYQSLMEKDYETAFKELYLYEEGTSNGEVSLTNEEAKTKFLEKTEYLKGENYKFKGFKITDIEYEDGNSFWHHVNVEVELDGENFNYEEQAFFHEGKLKVSGDDPYIQYRDGNLNLELNK